LKGDGLNLRFLRRLCAAACLFPVCAAVHAGDPPQWGAAHSRNMVSAETGLPDAVAAEGDGGPLWSVGLGDNSYGTPVVAGGRVYIGANNLNPVDARLQGDYGLLYCLSEKDGVLLWKLGTPRIGGDDYLDWPGIAVCSPPTVEGDRVYAVTTATRSSASTRAARRTATTARIWTRASSWHGTASRLSKSRRPTPTSSGSLT
jgi:outer membrane protein assembly factor BamB